MVSNHNMFFNNSLLLSVVFALVARLAFAWVLAWLLAWDFDWDSLGISPTQRAGKVHN